MNDRGSKQNSIGTTINLKAFLLIVTSALALGGCSSEPKAKIESGPIHASTFSFVTAGGHPSTSYTENRQAVHEMIQEAITKNLAAKGVSKVPSGGEVTVGYLVVTGNNTSTKSINDYFGYSADSADIYDKAHQAYTHSKNPNYFEAGTLLIDLIDPKTFKVLERNYATRQLLRNLPPDARAARVQEVVDEILQNVRIGQ